MPEGPEIETEKLHEAIHEEVEHEGGAFLKRLPRTPPPSGASPVTGRPGGAPPANEGWFLKTEAPPLRPEASDKWAYYQAKGIKASTGKAPRPSGLAIEKKPPAE